MTSPSRDWSSFYSQLRGFVATRVPAPADVDDLVQVVLERALRRAPAELDNVAAWLFGVARNAVADYYREHARLSLAVAEAIEADEAPAPIGDVDRSVVLACMEPLLTSLSREDAQLLRWADMQERSIQTIASDLGISLTAAKSRVQRARKAFVKATRACCVVSQDTRGRVIGLNPRSAARIEDCECTVRSPIGKIQV
jgi:RNA polymerase sigma-70 factor, ECF subfamily